MSKKKVLLRGVFINRDTNGEGVLKVGTTLIRVSTVMGILYYDMESIINQKQKFITTKEDKLNHGIGLENISRTVKKYDGDMRISQENERFIVSINI